jgi:hypothetical protein
VRYSILLAVIVSFLDVAAAPAEEGLFSEVAMESVFEKPAPVTKRVASQSNAAKLERITGVSSLILALKAAGMDPQEQNGRATFELDHDGWSFPVSIGVQIEQDRIDCELSLIKISDNTTVKTQTLLSLLASGGTRGASFAYDREEKLILLRASLSNRSITASQLKADLVHLATVAGQHSDVWLSLKAETKNDSPKTNSPKTNSPQQNLSLIGRWSAALKSGEVFAIQIASDSKFQLVHLKSGKSTISKGKATRSGAQLKLVGDNNVTLNCTVTQTTSDAFQLAVKDAKGNVAVTLNFKKAK